jgi:quinohemoprotein ethanol dehydrogenase
MAYHPQTGLVYIPASESSFLYGRDTAFTFRPGFWNLGIDLAASIGMGRTGPTRPQSEYSGGTGEAAGAASSLLAWDPLARRARWRVLHTDAVGGGTLTTAGNLVFQGLDTGKLVAYRADNGEKVWEKDVGIGIMAAPSTYSIDGKQYVAVLAGMGGASALYGRNPTNMFKAIGRVYAFALDASVPAPPVRGIDRPAPTPIENSAAAAQITRGAELFGQRCSMCHGVAAQSGGSIADLRYAAPATFDAFENIVRRGAYVELGMPRFDWLTDADVAALRGYVLSRRAALLAAAQR